MTSFRLFCLLILGFSSGLPLALTGSTLQAWLTVENVDLKTIALYSIVGFPYTYKFLWAPLLDRFHPQLFDRRRGWIVWMQLLCAALIGGMAFVEAQSTWTLACLALAISFCSATQDMAIDAYRTELLTAQERGLGAAHYVAGYRGAMLVSGGLALILADLYLGWRGTYVLMGLLMAVCAIMTALSPQVASEKHLGSHPTNHLLGILKTSLADFLRKPGAIAILLVIVLYKMGDAFAGSLSTAFLLKGLGFTLTEVGAVNKTVSLIGSLMGAFLGGWLMKHWGLYRSLMLFGVLQAGSNLSFWVLTVLAPEQHIAIWGNLLSALSLHPLKPELLSMSVAVLIENLCGGMGTAAFVGLLTSLCTREFSATQYALLSSVASVGRVYLSAPAGYAVAAWGWGHFFIASTVLALPGLVALFLTRAAIRRVDH